MRRAWSKGKLTCGKTSGSMKPVPMHPALADYLNEWRSVTPYSKDSDWVFDLGYLLHKSPLRVHSFEQVFGKTHVFYPETTPERCTAALLLEIDPVVVRDRRGPSDEGYAPEQYVDDRP